MNAKIVRNEIMIQAPTQIVWNVLTNSAYTKIYMFGCDALSDWEVGSSLLWQGNYQGQDMVFVKGMILAIEPELLLKYTVIDPNSGMPDIPENYLNVTYTLENQGNATKLIVTQDGFEHAADGEKRYQDVYNNGEGWNPILVEIKKICENI